MITAEQLHPNDRGHHYDYIAYMGQKFCVAREYQPKIIIEIGVRAGYSAYAFKRAVPNAYFFGFDAESGTHGGEGGPYMPWAQKLLSEFPHVKLIEADTQHIESLNGETSTEHLYADLIHVDGDHSEKGVMHDLELALKHLSPEGIILIDDVYRSAEVRKGVRKFLAGHPELDHIYMPSWNGDVIIGKVHSLEESPEKEAQLIDNFVDKKLVEYLRPGQRNLILFGHGLGDTVMFMPIFDKLKAMYPEVDFELYLEAGQEDFFECVRERPTKGYDYHFQINYPMSEGSGLTKNALCCRDEIGIGAVEFVPGSGICFRGHERPFVAVHFQGTALPGSVNATEEKARAIWEAVKAEGLIPIEVHFQHVFHNPVNEKFEWIDRSVRDVDPSIDKLAQIFNCCRFFIGIASGPFVVALDILGSENVLFIERRHKLHDYVQDGWSMALDEVNEGSIRDWLKGPRKKARQA